jgi:acyl-homoserine lactone synthase
MIQAVSLANRHLYGRQLDRISRMCHAIYVEGHGWSGLTSMDGGEADESDNVCAVYLMSINPTHLAHTALAR